jgi:hypothetical protein
MIDERLDHPLIVELQRFTYALQTARPEPCSHEPDAPARGEPPPVPSLARRASLAWGQHQRKPL